METQLHGSGRVRILHPIALPSGKVELKSASIPPDEDKRTAKLDLYEILDTPREEAFDRITRIVSTALDVPIALVSLVDRDRQWFKSRVGLDVSETARAYSFCAHAIHDSDLFVVNDATEDERFFDNPLVTQAPSIRFYAGAPLVTPDGYKLGTLCAIDKKPRKITAKQQGFLEDLAEIVVDEIELRTALADTLSLLAEVRALEADRDNYFLTVNHEIRTPLTSIRGALGLLAGGAAGKLPEKADRLVLMANRSTERLIEMVNELLDRDKLLVGSEHKVKFSIVNTGEALSEACEAMYGLAQERDVILEKQVLQAPTVMADGTRLRQALTNLLSNAIKFSAEGGKVIARLTREKDTARFTIEDEGPGISSEFQNIMYDRFTRAEDAQDKPGSGLGLSIVRSIVEAHGGIIECQSTLGKGSSFSIWFPLRHTLKPLRKSSKLPRSA